MANTEKQFKLKNVRLSYPSLWERSTYKGNVGKYQASFIMDDETAQPILDYISELDPKGEVETKKCCLKEGDSEKRDTAGMYVFCGKNNVRPQMRDEQNKELLEGSELLAPGCYVNAIVAVYRYNDFICGKLYGLAFVKEGESLSSNPPDEAIADALADFGD